MRTFVITVTAVGREPVQTGLGGGAYLMLAKAEEYRAMAITCGRKRSSAEQAPSEGAHDLKVKTGKS